jgi:hypothetical protein
MFLTFAIGFTIVSTLANEELGARQKRAVQSGIVQLYAQRKVDQAYHQYLEFAQRSIIQNEFYIKTFEEYLTKDYAELVSPEEAKELRAEIEVLRDGLLRYKLLEKELLKWDEKRKQNLEEETEEIALQAVEKIRWELWYKTAPMPREKK